jgi:hypothetical protein
MKAEKSRKQARAAEPIAKPFVAAFVVLPRCYKECYCWLSWCNLGVIGSVRTMSRCCVLLSIEKDAQH